MIEKLPNPTRHPDEIVYDMALKLNEVIEAVNALSNVPRPNFERTIPQSQWNAAEQALISAAQQAGQNQLRPNGPFP